jgi:type IV pilus assembly protein PilC
MLTVILPKFAQIFARLGTDLPVYTQFLMNLSKAVLGMIKFPWSILTLISVLSIFFGVKTLYSIKKGRYIIDKIALYVPVFGSLLKKVGVARFTRTFGTLIKSGVPILTSLEIVEESSGNAVLAKAVRKVSDEVRQGGTISMPLEKSGIFPPMVVSMIAVGEETGELDSMLAKIADFYDAEVEAAVDALTSLLEPLMMVFIGGVVGSVIVGMYLPMFKIFESIK